MVRGEKQTKTSVEKILHEVKKVIAGKDDVLEKIMMTVLSRGHVLLDDVPGTGKTTTALAFSRALGLQYGRIQFTPDVLPSDIVGFSMYHKESGSFVYQPGAVMTNLLLADEINRTSSKTQSALLEVMEERQVTVDGQTHKLPDPFVVIATQNPVETEGTYPLPEAQLDRFLMQISMGYPSKEEELTILDRFGSGNPLTDLKAVCNKKDLASLKTAASAIFVHPLLKDYLVNLVQATRNDSQILDGGSPRGSLALYRAAIAYALVKGRDYVIPEDIRAVCHDVLRHRIGLTYEAEAENVSTEEIVTEILNNVEVP